MSWPLAFNNGCDFDTLSVAKSSPGKCLAVPLRTAKTNTLVAGDSDVRQQDTCVLFLQRAFTMDGGRKRLGKETCPWWGKSWLMWPWTGEMDGMKEKRKRRTSRGIITPPLVCLMP